MPEAAVRLLGSSDAAAALVLYNALTVGPKAMDHSVFDAVISHQGTSVFGAFAGAKLAAMVTLHLLPNVLWEGRSYGLIENVITAPEFQRQGYGRQAMQAALDAAWAADAYKVMLMTGQGRGATGFYEALGFSSKDKFAYVQRRD